MIKAKQVIYYPHLNLKSPIDQGAKIDAFEIHPCRVVERNKVGVGDKIEEVLTYEQCEETDPDIATWGVYVHFTGGGLENIVDAPTKEDAEAFVTTMEKIIANYQPSN